jgi:hypothetical protein
MTNKVEQVLSALEQSYLFGDTPQSRVADNKEDRICSDCPPNDYPTNATRCDPCPRRAPR